MLETDSCNICGKKLISVEDTLNVKEKECYYCKKNYSPLIFCSEGHYVCDNCHSQDAKGIISEYCLNTTNTDPYSMAEEIMTHPKFNIYGPELVDTLL